VTRLTTRARQLILREILRLLAARGRSKRCARFLLRHIKKLKAFASPLPAKAGRAPPAGTKNADELISYCAGVELLKLLTGWQFRRFCAASE
jgi:hypothetical protein